MRTPEEGIRLPRARLTIDPDFTIAPVPLIVVFMLFQRQIIRGVATTGLGGT